MIGSDFTRFGVTASAAVLLLGLAGGPARAGDDGAAPIWDGFAVTLGLKKSPNDVQIDYREHGRLVLPPKRDLVSPGATSARASTWPLDPDVEQARKDKIKEKKDDQEFRPYGRPGSVFVTPGATVTMSATAGHGPHDVHCRVPDPKTGACPDKPSSEWNMNPMTWIGLQKKPELTLREEPERESLTDPPKGLRAPVEGVGAKVEN